MEDLSVLHPGSPAFSQLEYTLQSLSKSSTLRITSAWEVSNPALSVAFDRRSKGLLTLESWLDTSQLSMPNQEEDVIKRGFVLPSGNAASSPAGGAASLVFPVGPMDWNNPEQKVVKKRLLFCKVAVGKAFCAPDMVATQGALPDHYDSFYLDPEYGQQELNGAKEAGKALDAAAYQDAASPFGHVSGLVAQALQQAQSAGLGLQLASPLMQHLESLDFCKQHKPSSPVASNAAGSSTVQAFPLIKYFIRDASQALPRFIVEFEYDPKAERNSRQKSLCENCETELATFYCPADVAYLCTRCDADVHKSKLAARHQRQSLEKGPQCNVQCRIHPERMAEFFCPSCHVLVCLSCKMVGHHSSGEAARHSLVPVKDAYASVLEASHAPDPVLQERTASLLAQLSSLSARGAAILTNAKAVRLTLASAFLSALSELNKMVKHRLLVLKGESLDVKRHVADIERIRQHLAYLETGRDATLFLLSWHQYLQAKTDLPLGQHASGVASNLLEAPLQVSGQLAIVSADGKQASLGQGYQPSHRGSVLLGSAASSILLSPSRGLSDHVSVLHQQQQHQDDDDRRSIYLQSSQQVPLHLASGRTILGRQVYPDEAIEKASDLFADAIQDLDLAEHAALQDDLDQAAHIDH